MELHVPGVIAKVSDGVIVAEYVPSAQVTVIVIGLLDIGLEMIIINAVIALPEVTVAPLSPLPYFKVQLLV